jgi:uncharacterized protein (DUF2062 family)
MRELLRRFVVGPVLNLLEQGLTPEKLALSLALGVVCGLFPVLGATTLLCVAFGFGLRLSHAALQLANYLVYPIQVALILLFVRLGERTVQAPPIHFSLPTIFALARENPGLFLERFGLTALHAMLGWGIVAPFIAAGLYFVLLPVLRTAAVRLRPPGAPAP